MLVEEGHAVVAVVNPTVVGIALLLLPLVK